MAFASVRADAVTTQVASATTDWSGIGLPDTVAAGDEILTALITGNDTPPTSWTPPSGWSQLGSIHTFGSTTITLFTKDTVVGDEDGGTEDWTCDNASRGVAISMAIASSNGTIYVSSNATGTSDSPDPPSLDPGVGALDFLWLVIAGARDDDATVSAYPADFTHFQIEEQSGGGTNAGGEGAVAARQLNASSLDPGAFTLSESEQWLALTLAIEPAAGVSVTPERAELSLAARDAAVQVPISVTPERAELSLEARAPLAITIATPSLSWPESGRLQVGLEASIDGSWTDLTGYQRGESSDLVIDITRGRADLAAETEPSEMSTVLDASDGELMPANPASSLWPYWRRGAEIRHSVDGETPALVLPGEPGSYCFTPDHPDFDVTDLDVRIRVQPDAWSTGVVYADGTFVGTTRQWLVSRWTETGNDRSWVWYLLDAGWPTLLFSADGSAETGSTGFPALVAALAPIWLALTVDADDGGGNRVATWWRYDGETPPDDVTEWDQIVEVTDAGTMSLHATGAPLAIGAINEGSDARFAGRVLALEMRDVINGTLVADPDFTQQNPGSTGFFDSTGKPWVLAGDARISRRQIRFNGNIAALKPEWPYRDHNAGIDLDDIGGRPPSEARVAVTAAGLLRRLTQGQSPLRSALRRQITSAQYVNSIAAYWPCEDASSATSIASGLPGGIPMGITGLSMAADSSLPASAPLPTVESGDTATWSGLVAGGSTDWVAEWVSYQETGETDPTVTELMSVKSAGTIATWRLDVNDTYVILTELDGLGATVNVDVTAHGGVVLGVWILWRLTATQDGADVDYTLEAIDLDAGLVYLMADDTLSSETLGAVTEISGHMIDPPDGISFGHIVVHDGLPLGWLAGADTAWAGEAAARRIWRLCAEQGIPIEIIGDPAAAFSSVAASGRGDLAASQAMGPQQRKTLPELIAECVAVDQGVLIERRAVPGLVYRTRTTIEDQAVALVLDAAQGDVINPVEPTEDDARLRNDVTVTSTGGSSAQAVDETSIAEVGRYDAGIEIAGVGGLAIQSAILATQDGLPDAVAEQNLQQASWRLSLGTTEGLRYPTVTIDFRTMSDSRAREQIDTWLQTALGDRIQVINLPVQVPDEAVELIIEHIAEDVTPSSWIVELACSPGDPWLTGELVE